MGGIIGGFRFVSTLRQVAAHKLHFTTQPCMVKYGMRGDAGECKTGKYKFMPKVKVHLMDKKKKSNLFWEFFEVVSSLNGKKETVDFLFGLLTQSEILMIARRIQIAKMLLEENNYEEIRRRLKVSYQTVSKVDHWLKRDVDKNRLIVKKIKEVGKKRAGKFSSGLLSKYPQHRIWEEIFN